MESSIDYRPCVLYGSFLASFENLDFNMPVSESVTTVSITCSYYKCKHSCYDYQRNNTVILAQLKKGAKYVRQPPKNHM